MPSVWYKPMINYDYEDCDENVHINRSSWQDSSMCTRQATQKHYTLMVILAIKFSSTQRNNAYVSLLRSHWRQSY